uniref:Reverse transcriptase zinc-binding domain-containing protein n=1 Tax=Cannabis sativa TaxID=3483 RepID=A0A803QI44_CANSA
MSNFWWGSISHKRKIHWKSWYHLCMSKFFGGLGFRNIVHHNQAMLAKQAWRIFTTPDSLVTSLLKAKYFKHNDFLNAATGHSPSFCWRSILWGKELLIKGLIWKIGDGTSVRITDPNWLPDWDNIPFKSDHIPLSQMSLSSLLRIDIGTQANSIITLMRVLLIPSSASQLILLTMTALSGNITLLVASQSILPTIWLTPIPQLLVPLILLPLNHGGHLFGRLIYPPKSNISSRNLLTISSLLTLTFSIDSPGLLLLVLFASLI